MNPATRSIEDRLTATLIAVADQTPVTDQWERLVADLQSPTPSRGLNGRRLDHRPRFRLLAAAAAVVAAVGGGALALVGPWGSGNQAATVAATESGVDLVLPGEVVVADDPLTVQAAPGPEPRFDTGTLGTELVFEPLLPDDPAVAGLLALSMAGEEGRTVTKVTLLGRVNGEPWITVVSDGPNVNGIGGASTDANLRTLDIQSGDSGSGTGDLVPIDSLEMIALPDVDGPEAANGPAYTAPTGWVEWGPVPATAAAVTFADSDTRLWIRPRAGMAFFPAQFDDGEQFTVQALDAEGEVIWTRSETVSYGGEPPPPDAPVDGMSLGVLAGADETGRPVAVEPAPGTTALLIGAPWCVPCESGLADAVDALTAFDPDVRIVAVPHYIEEGQTWPTGSDWPHLRLHPDVESPLKAVMVMPTVILLDGTNTVVATWRGFDETAERLDAIVANRAQPSTTGD